MPVFRQTSSLRAILPVAGLIATLALGSAAAYAAPDKNTPAPAAKPVGSDDPARPAPAAADSTTEGSVTVGGQRISYQAVVGTLTVGSTEEQDALLGLDGKLLPGMEGAMKEAKDPTEAVATARMSYVAYFKTGEKAEQRPVTFFYNGGPGSSTMWLHMGSLGPRQ